MATPPDKVRRRLIVATHDTIRRELARTGYWLPLTARIDLAVALVDDLSKRRIFTRVDRD